jgi:hypothetical protein
MPENVVLAAAWRNADSYPRARNVHLVVPANAGTHNPWILN